ncbi:MAG: DinB family protein [Ignavibacteriae bacterium]|nr:MAG: DinB family protein [Ignavibacteriota bacterium]
MKAENSLQNQLIDYLENQYTHRSLADAAKDLPDELINVKPENVPYTFYQMLEHIRITQIDMIDFINNPNYRELEWPKDFWPDEKVKATKDMWNESVEKYQMDLNTLKDIIKGADDNIFERIPHGTGQTIFREVLQVIDHNSYHIGELILMRKLCNAWGK